MAALPYIQLYTADYLADTMHLTTEEHGAYLLLIFNYWQTGKPIPKKRLQKIARISNDRWPSVEDSLSEFFADDGEFWVHGRIERDLDAVKDAQEQRVKAGRASAEARKRSKQTKSEREVNDRSTPVEIPLERKGSEKPTNKDTDTDTDTKNKTLGPSASDAPTQSESAKAGRSEKKPPYPQEFELAWQKYPKRPGSNPKRQAFKAWSARTKEGHDPAVILAGVIRYAKFCQSTGKANTEYVMQAVRFFGTSCEFENEWTPPEPFPDRPRHSGFSEIDYSQGLKQEVPDGVANF
ncbi:YdaU family protein [Marinobacter sp. NSM]|uniref:YdaU family protein n=1 Tax=Marinobacter sp. NSM TaxID=3458004 RepID=UPI004036AF97